MMTMETTTQLEPESSKRRIEPILDASGTLRHPYRSTAANDILLDKAQDQKAVTR
jgi:hypothetical protein